MSVSPLGRSASDPAPRPPAATLPRRPTADRRRYLIRREQLPRDFAERLQPTSPVVPRPAATVVLLREESERERLDTAEVLLLRRHRQSGFAAGAWVFPGGTVDPEDQDPALPAMCDGPPPDKWAERLKVRDPAEAFAFPIAAVREAFEETGILLARAGVGGNRERDAAVRRDAVTHRDALLAGETSLRKIAASHGLRYALDELLYIGHWITPESVSRRYDTRFFLAPLPAEAECLAHEPELVEERWLTPADAVRRFEEGEMNMLPPTVETLRQLDEFSSLAELRHALRDSLVPAILPRMRSHPEGVVIEW